MATGSSKSGNKTGKKEVTSGKKTTSAGKKTTSSGKKTLSSGKNAMSAGKKRNTGTKAVRKETVSVKPDSIRNTTEETGKSSELNNEVVLLITLVISLLLFLSNFSLSGKFGEVINRVTFGLFGFFAYLIPFLLFFGIAFYLANHKANRKYIGKLLEAVGLFAAIAGIIQLAFGEVAQGPISSYYSYSAANKNGGGFLGGLLCTLLVPVFGKAGSFVVLAAFAIFFVMLLTGRALFAMIAEFGVASAQKHKEQRLRKEEEDALYEQQELELIQETRAQSFLLRPAKDKEREEPKEEIRKNFFGGISPTAPIGREQPADNSTKVEKKPPEETKETTKVVQQSEAIEKDKNKETALDSETEQLVYNGTYTPSKDTVEAVNSIYEEELRKKFDHMFEMPKEEPSFSEQSLSDRRRMESGPREKTIFERMPYGLSKEQPKQTAQETVDVIKSAAAEEEEARPKKEYVVPPMELLARPFSKSKGSSEQELHKTAEKLKNTLESFGVGVTITNVSRGPSVTRYELQPEQGVKVSKITNLADDIKLNLAAADVRIEAPIPGKAAVGIEVPNKENVAVLLRELIESPEFSRHSSDIAFTVGKDIGGQNIVADIGKMPHLLIAGATGSGKSVCINTIIMSILYKAKPTDVKLIMVDPKVVELSVYNGIPHLMIPVVTDPKKASAALNWAVAEMTDRYQKFAELSVRDLKGYNEQVESMQKEGLASEKYPKLPRIVIIVDELADLMMVAPGEVEDAICRLAQMARAAGLHLILATQRPSVNVITGLIKANVPSRIAFAVSSGIDSRTILDSVGAEKLLGKGDMLFFPSGYSKPVRIQGAFVSDKEVSSVVEFLKSQNEGEIPYDEEITNHIAVNATAESAAGALSTANSGRDEYFAEAGRFIIEKEKASIGMLQRVYKIGFNRAARIMDQLSEAGVVGPEEGTKPRKILMSMEEFEQYMQKESS